MFSPSFLIFFFFFLSLSSYELQFCFKIFLKFPIKNNYFISSLLQLSIERNVLIFLSRFYLYIFIWTMDTQQGENTWKSQNFVLATSNCFTFLVCSFHLKWTISYKCAMHDGTSWVSIIILHMAIIILIFLIFSSCSLFVKLKKFFFLSLTVLKFFFFKKFQISKEEVILKKKRKEKN